MDRDAETVGAWLGRWWIEATLGLVALVGVGTGALAGDPVRIVVAVALAAAVVDRVRLRMDNRSLALAVWEVRDGRVSAVRRESSGGVESDAAEAGRGDEDGAAAGSDGTAGAAITSATDED